MEIYYKGETPLELYSDIPEFIIHAHWHIALCGLVGLIIMFGLPMLKVNFLKKVPAPMIVLLITIPMAIFWHFENTEPDYSLVTIGNFWGDITMNADFSAIATFPFWKYVLMFLFVSSLESLLTVKAVDALDPFGRKSDANGDLKAQGFSNALSGFLGGLPMISEVVRSTSNIGFGARTKWSNFFHGIFLLIAMLLMIPLIELIPNAALATMLIYAGFRLASPKEFMHMYHIGKGQMIVFLVTIFFTLFEDLLIGVAAGIVTELIIHIINGASVRHLFSSKHEVINGEDKINISINESATFSNLIGFRNILQKLPEDSNVEIDFSKTKLVDHSFMNFITKFKHDFEHHGGKMVISGLDEHIPFSKHHLAARRKKK
jgi:MFS superfamily sulfate permease-like transporter